MPLSDARKKEFEEAFTIFDQDKSGFLSTKIAGVAMRSLSQCPTDAELTSIFARLAPDGKVDREALYAAAGEMEATMGNQQQELLSAFAIFDKDGTGMVQAAEVKHILSNIEGCEDDEVEEMVKEFDGKGEGTINYAEFVKKIFEPHVRPVVPPAQ